MHMRSKFLILVITLFSLVACSSHSDDDTTLSSEDAYTTTAPIKLTIPEKIAIYIEHDMAPQFKCAAKSCSKQSMATVYQHRGYLPIWLNENGEIKPEVHELITVLENSYKDGLNPTRYRLDLIQKLVQQIQNNNSVDMLQQSAKLDMELSDAYIAYGRDIQNGRINPVASYPDWGVSRNLIDVGKQFESAINENSLIDTLEQMPPTNPQYLKLRDKLAGYNKIIFDSNSELSNRDIATMKQIILNMDRLRWLPRNLSESYLWVNIPQFELDAINNSQIMFQMPVVVGKDGENKTCSVISDVTMVEINPYWGIPRRIATQEYLAKLKVNPMYLANKNIRIYNKNNKEVDPLSIDWSNVNENNFQYTFKQDPGNKNALGKVKFIFPNNCGIYLHDTSSRNVFSRDERSMSHGCIRLGKPLELANYILVEREHYSADRIDKLINSDDHSGLKLKQPLPLYIVYQTLVINDSGEIVRYKDIYGIDNVDVSIYQPKHASKVAAQ